MNHNKLKQVIKKLNSNGNYFTELNNLYHEVASRMLEKIELIKVSPQIILNLGSGLGIDSKLITKKYPKATVYQVDIAHHILKHQQPDNFLQKIFYCNKDLITANAYQLPFANNSFDMVWSNLLLPYISDINSFFKEVKRVLKPHGILLISGFGVDSLAELRTYKLNTANFPDLHVIGDLLYQLKFQEPVTDVDFIIYKQQNLAKILQLSKLLGASRLFDNYQYLSKQVYSQLIENLSNLIDIKLEVFYAYAVKPASNNEYIKIQPIFS
jgi:malonyl-CoA O-methyltransferase